MQKKEILLSLQIKHQQFDAYITSLSNQELEYAKPNKWTAAQQVQHIYKSIRPLALGLQLPKFLIKLIWGKANRNSKTFITLINNYNDKLMQGGVASKPFVPKKIAASDVQYWLAKMQKAVKKLQKNIQKFTEDELDKFILPHPLLGKVTLREMLYFTLYHVEHHKNIIKRDLV